MIASVSLARKSEPTRSWRARCRRWSASRAATAIGTPSGEWISVDARVAHLRNDRPVADSVLVERIRRAAPFQSARPTSPEFTMGSHTYNRCAAQP